MRTKIIIADDHELFAKGLNQILTSNPSYQLNGWFSNGKQVIDYFANGYSADLLILDINMPVINGVQVMGHLQRNYPKVKKLVLSMHRTSSSVELCKNLGAHGIVGKDEPLQVLLDSIHSILNGEEYFKDLPSLKSEKEDDGFYKKLAKQFHLSKRETEIIQLILNQYESNEIAEKLNLSQFTVRTHRRNIFEKLRVRNLAGLVSFLKNFPDY